MILLKRRLKANEYTKEWNKIRVRFVLNRVWSSTELFSENYSLELRQIGDTISCANVLLRCNGSYHGYILDILIEKDSSI